MNTRFADKDVLITGAGSEIGRETAVSFAREGATVALVARTRENLLSAKEIERAGGAARAVPVGLVDEEGEC